MSSRVAARARADVRGLEQVLEVARELGHPVAQLPGCDRQPEHLEDSADVLLGRGRVDALTFGDAPDELPAVEALGRLGRRGQPGTHLGRQERGDVLRLAAADPIRERAQRGLDGALDVGPDEPGGALGHRQHRGVAHRALS